MQLRELVTSSPYYNNVDPPELQFRHDLMKAKLFGFLDDPKTVFFRYPDTDQSLPAMYARAIATYRQSGIKVAAPQIDALIAAKPDWPYFYEIKGQFLFESGKPADAIAPLREAVRLTPDEPLIRIMLAQAMLGSNDPAARGRGDQQSAHRSSPRGQLGHGLPPAGRGLRPQGRGGEGDRRQDSNIWRRPSLHRPKPISMKGS